MENTKRSTPKDGIWRSEPIPLEDRRPIYHSGSTEAWAFGHRLTDGMATSNEAEYGSLPPAARTGME